MQDERPTVRESWGKREYRRGVEAVRCFQVWGDSALAAIGTELPCICDPHPHDGSLGVSCVGAVAIAPRRFAVTVRYLPYGQIESPDPRYMRPKADVIRRWQKTTTAEYTLPEPRVPRVLWAAFWITALAAAWWHLMR
jgi:hypothetical protein